MKRRHTLCMLGALVTLGALLLPGVIAAQNELADRVLMLEAQTEAYPELVIGVGVYDDFGRPIGDLRAQEITVAIDGQPATVALQVEQRPPAVVIVADMSFVMNDVSLPGQGRVPTMVSQIRRMLAILPPDTSVSLVVFDAQERLEAGWSPSTELAPKLELLLKRPLPAAAANAPYPLTSAIALGLQQFSQADPLADSRPRALFVYAAGAPQQTIDGATLQRHLAELTPNPPLITLVGLGSSTPGAFAKQPGNPESLLQLVSSFASNTGVYCRFFTANPAETELLQSTLDRQSEQVANLEPTLKLTLANLALTPGVHQLNVMVHEITVTQRIRIPAVPPTIMLPEFTQPLDDGSPVSVQVQFAQQPVREVAYYLDGQPIGVSTASPDFVLTPDLARYRDESDQPRTLQLAAIATDSAGQQSERVVTSVRIVPIEPAPAPSPEPPTMVITMASSMIVIILVTIMLLVVTPRGRATLRVLAGGPERRSVGPEEPIISVTIKASDAPVGVTEFAPLPKPGATIEVVSGDQRRVYPLAMGKLTTVGRGAPNEINLADGQISQRHAQLEWTPKGIRLMDLDSRNGTYIGERRRKLAPNTPELLRAGDSFWLGQHTKLVIR